MLTMDKAIEKAYKELENWQNKKPVSNSFYSKNIYALLDAMIANGKNGYIVFVGYPDTGDIYYVYGTIGSEKIDKLNKRIFKSFEILKRMRLDKDIIQINKFKKTVARLLSNKEEKVKNAILNKFDFDILFFTHKVAGFEVNCKGDNLNKVYNWIDKNLEKLGVCNVAFMKNRKSLFVWLSK